MSDSKSAVAIVDGKPFLELTAPELIYPVTLEQEGQEFKVAFHMLPYAGADLKQVFSGMAARFKRSGGSSMGIIPGDRGVCKPFFDRYFLRISGGEDATVEEQKAWLDANDFIKSDFVINGMSLEVPQSDGQEPKSLRFALNGNHPKPVTVKQRLIPESGASEVEIILEHSFSKIDPKHHIRFERASLESELNTRKGEWKTSEDYDAIEKLYDDLVESVNGALLNGKPCGLETKAGWIRLVPFRQKSVTVDELFRRIRLKNA